MSISSAAAVSSSASSLSLSQPEKFKLHNDQSKQDNDQVQGALQATKNTVTAKAGVDIKA